MLLTPEKSIELQNAIGADIIMQLDDVVSSLTEGPRVAEAMHRSIRWLDRFVDLENSSMFLLKKCACFIYCAGFYDRV